MTAVACGHSNYGLSATTGTKDTRRNLLFSPEAPAQLFLRPLCCMCAKLQLESDAPAPLSLYPLCYSSGVSCSGAQCEIIGNAASYCQHSSRSHIRLPPPSPSSKRVPCSQDKGGSKEGKGVTICGQHGTWCLRCHGAGNLVPLMSQHSIVTAINSAPQAVVACDDAKVWQAAAGCMQATQATTRYRKLPQATACSLRQARAHLTVLLGDRSASADMGRAAFRAVPCFRFRV